MFGYETEDEDARIFLALQYQDSVELEAGALIKLRISVRGIIKARLKMFQLGKGSALLQERSESLEIAWKKLSLDLEGEEEAQYCVSVVRKRRGLDE